MSTYYRVGVYGAVMTLIGAVVTLAAITHHYHLWTVAVVYGFVSPLLIGKFVLPKGTK